MAKKKSGKACKWVTAEWSSARSQYDTISCHRTQSGAEKAAKAMRRGGRSPVEVMLKSKV
jgi:hypothetical protein